MKKSNLLSKAEMKKVKGGDDPDPGSLCVPTVHCLNPDNNQIVKIEVGDCEAQSPGIVCYINGYAGTDTGCVSC